MAAMRTTKFAIILALYICNIASVNKYESHSKKNEQVANMIFGSIYPLYLKRLEKNGRTEPSYPMVYRF